MRGYEKNENERLARLRAMKDKPSPEYQGRTGSLGGDAPAIADEMVTAISEAGKVTERIKTQLKMGVEGLDAQILRSALVALERMNEIMDQPPPEFSNPDNDHEVAQRNVAAQMMHQKTLISAAGVISRLIQRLPMGAYNPTVIIEGQRYAIPTDAREWGLYEGRPHLAYSIAHIVNTTSSRAGKCINTIDGRCYFLTESESEGSKRVEIESVEGVDFPKE